jgi:hypothetical protein
MSYKIGKQAIRYSCFDYIKKAINSKLMHRVH